KTTTNQNETQTETQDMLKEDQEFQETENIDETENGSEEVSASAEATEERDDSVDEEIEASDREPTLEERAAEAESKYKEMQDRYLRLNAEFDNYKKRMMRENTDRLKYFNMELIKELLPSVDNLERAISHAGDENSDLENMIEGLQMVYKGMQEAFGKFGVSEIESIGKEFDPNCHQAVGMIESQEVPENHVAEECLKGYYLHDRIIRPTMVRVSGKG
ncbi:MAG: nucleotide exchange factor GrpE, partial [SAR324 cluster bacterium]|nr:nucleotide exchange factor GrpE [SAR324 cluster bacterium]